MQIRCSLRKKVLSEVVLKQKFGFVKVVQDVLHLILVFKRKGFVVEEPLRSLFIMVYSLIYLEQLE